MQNNRIWEQVAGFMQQLRCENLSEKSVVQMPGQKEVQKKLEQAQEQGEELLEQMQEKERGLFKNGWNDWKITPLLRHSRRIVRDMLIVFSY